MAIINVIVRMIILSLDGILLTASEEENIIDIIDATQSVGKRATQISTNVTARETTAIQKIRIKISQMSMYETFLSSVRGILLLRMFCFFLSSDADSILSYILDSLNCLHMYHVGILIRRQTLRDRGR